MLVVKSNISIELKITLARQIFKIKQCNLFFCGKLYRLGCGKGYYSVYPTSDSCECKICQIGTYNSDEQSDSCESCPSGWTTLQEGREEYWECRQCKKFNFFFSTSHKQGCGKVMFLHFSHFVHSGAGCGWVMGGKGVWMVVWYAWQGTCMVGRGHAKRGGMYD